MDSYGSDEKDGKLLVAVFGTIAIAVPLAIWKIVDIAIWIANNVQIGNK